MDVFLQTFLAGLGVAIVGGIGWLAFFQPRIYSVIFGWIIGTTIVVYGLVSAWAFGYMSGQSAQWYTIVNVPDDATSFTDRFPRAPMAVDLVVIGIVAGCVIIGGVILQAISQASPHNPSEEPSEQDAAENGKPETGPKTLPRKP